MEKTQLKDWTLLLPWLKNTTDMDVDSLNGELYYKLTPKKIYPPTWPSKKLPGD